jgi:hypothetical protein
MLTSYLAGVFSGEYAPEPASKDVLWNNVKNVKYLSLLNTIDWLTVPLFDSVSSLIVLVVQETGICCQRD